MTQRLALILVCGLLTVGGAACAPPRVGPTAGAGYVFTLQVADPIIWLGPVDAAVARQFPQVTAVIVQVQDAQGHPVDGVPVTFEVEPGWGSGAARPESMVPISGIRHPRCGPSPLGDALSMGVSPMVRVARGLFPVSP